MEEYANGPMPEKVTGVLAVVLNIAFFTLNYGILTLSRGYVIITYTMEWAE